MERAMSFLKKTNANMLTIERNKEGGLREISPRGSEFLEFALDTVDHIEEESGSSTLKVVAEVVLEADVVAGKVG